MCINSRILFGNPPPSAARGTDQAPGTRDWRLFFEVLVTGVIGLALLLISHSHVPSAPHPRWWVDGREIVRDIGVALLVGVTLMLTLEGANKRKIQFQMSAYAHLVGENFLRAVYGNAVPPQIFDTIRGTLLNEKFLRTAYNIQIRLCHFDGAALNKVPIAARAALTTAAHESDLILLRASVSYQVRNISSENAKYPCMIEVSRPLGPAYKFASGVTSVIIGGKQQLAAPVFDSGDEDPSVLRFFSPADVASGEEVAVSKEAYELRRGRDKETWQTVRPCAGMVVEVEDEDGSLDVVISKDAPLVGQGPHFASLDAATNRAVLAVREYLLPYQGVTITWGPRAACLPQVPPKAETTASSQNA